MKKKPCAHRSLPKIDVMLDWGVVKPGDVVVAKNHESEEGILLENGNVEVNGEEVPMHHWLKKVFGWASIRTYVFAVHKESGKTLDQLRSEYMEKKFEETIE